MLGRYHFFTRGNNSPVSTLIGLFASRKRKFPADSRSVKLAFRTPRGRRYCGPRGSPISLNFLSSENELSVRAKLILNIVHMDTVTLDTLALGIWKKRKSGRRSQPRRSASSVSNSDERCGIGAADRLSDLEQWAHCERISAPDN